MKNGKSRRNRRSTPITDEDKPETKLDRNTPDVETKGPTTPVRRNYDKGENGDPVKEKKPAKEKVEIIKEEKSTNASFSDISDTDIGPEEKYSRKRRSRSDSEDEYTKRNWHKQKFLNRRTPPRRSPPPRSPPPRSPRNYSRRVDSEFQNNRGQKYHKTYHKYNTGDALNEESRRTFRRYPKPYVTPDLWEDKFLRLSNNRLILIGGESLLRQSIDTDYKFCRSRPDLEEQKKICKFHRFKKCRDDNCPKTHPKECEKYKEQGKKGCEYYDCGLYHKTICATSWRGRDCCFASCPFLHYGTNHVMKTNDIDPSTSHTSRDKNENVVITNCPRNGCSCYEACSILERKLMHLFFDAAVIIKASNHDIFPKHLMTVPKLKSCSRLNCPCDQLADMDVAKFHKNYDFATDRADIDNISYLISQDWFIVELIGKKNNVKQDPNSQTIFKMSKQEEDYLLS